MKNTDQDEYSKSFHADDVVESDESMPAEDAAESADEAPAAAVMLTEDEGGEEAEAEAEAEGDAVAEDAEEMSPEDVQKEKSWAGRLKAREAELAAREAALAEREKGPVKLADGGKVDEEAGEEDAAMGDEAMDAADEEAEQPEEMAEGGEVDDMADEAPEVSDDDFVASIRDKSVALAKDPKALAGVLREMVNDYSESFVVGLIAAAGPLVEAMADPYVSDVESKIDGVIKSIEQAWTDRHFEAIRDAHEDFEDIAEADEFKAWADSLPEEDKAKVAETIERGSSGRIIALLTKYKDAMKSKDAPKEPTPEDIWAEDAAAGVKSSAPVSVAARAPASDEDEYKTAWDRT